MPSGTYPYLPKAERIRIAKQMAQLVRSLDKNTKHVEKMEKHLQKLANALVRA
jgi:hypothetical protein